MLADLGGTRRVAGIVEHGMQRVCQPRGGAAMARNRFADAQAFEPFGVVGLIVAERDDYRRLTGPHRLPGGAGSPLMDDRRGAREQLRIRSILRGEHAGRQCSEMISLVSADEKHSSAVELSCGCEALLIKIARDHYGGSPQREDNRRRTGIEKCGEFRRQSLPVFLLIVKGKTRDGRVRRPIGLGTGQQRRKQGQIGMG